MTYGRLGFKLLLAATLLSASGCASHQIANLDEYSPAALERSKFAPNEEQLKHTKSKIVVFALNENGNQVAAQAGLGVALAGSIELSLTEAQTVEIVDRQIASQLQEEIKLAEMNQTGSYTGPAIADYALFGTITNASFTHKFNEATSYVDKKGYRHVTPPSFRYTAAVDGIIKVYELPSMKVVNTFQISDNKGRSEETRGSGNFVDHDDDLVRGAGRDAVESIKTELQNEFAQKAYVIEKKVKESTAVYKISIGTENGAKSGDKCEIFTMTENLNQLTGKSDVEKHKVCDGVISNQITSNSSWVVASADESKKVQLGDQVKIVYSKSAGSYLKGAGGLMNTLLSK